MKKLLLGILRVNKNPRKAWKILEEDLIALLGTQQKEHKVFRQKIRQICDEKTFPCSVRVEKHISTSNWSYTFFSKIAK